MKKEDVVHLNLGQHKSRALIDLSEVQAVIKSSQGLCLLMLFKGSDKQQTLLFDNSVDLDQAYRSIIIKLT